MKPAEMISTTPIGTEKTVRGDEIRALTSCRAGKIVPVAYVPVLREDRVSRGSLRLSLDMAETIHPLMNAVNVTAYAHFVPFLAFERFGGSMEILNRSYQNKPEAHNDTVVPFFETMPYNSAHEIWKTMGVHWPEGQPINGAVIEAYNEVVNFRRKARSTKLPLRNRYASALAECFWKNTNLSHIVPDFDDAMMDGEVELQFVSSQIPIRSKLWATTGANNDRRSPAVPDTAGPAGVSGGFDWGDDIFAELKDSGVTLSLANIEVAKQTAAFAKVRDKYSALDDDHIIDLLMEGIRVPDEALKQPILLDRRSTIFGYSERKAMDGASLDMSVTTGSTTLDLKFRTPPMNTGGVILVTVEIVPEQLYERAYDQFLGTTDPDRLPNFLRDYLDPQKVDIVQNNFVDVFHSNPTGTFGYAPLNHAWKRSLSRVGGKYRRRNPDQFVEDRQRFWSVEQIDPTLNEDFFLVRNLPHTVFMDNVSDPFEILTLGSVAIVGNTQFGKVLEEDNDNYDAVRDQVDMTRINPDA